MLINAIMYNVRKITLQLWLLRGSYFIYHTLLHLININLLNTGSAFLATRVYKDTAKIRIMVTRVSTHSAGPYSPLFV